MRLKTLYSGFNILVKIEGGVIMDQDFFNLVNAYEPNIKQYISKCQQDLQNNDTNSLFYSARDLKDICSSAIDATNSTSVSLVYQNMKDVWSNCLDHLQNAAFTYENYGISTPDQINNANHEMALGIQTLANFDNLFHQLHPIIWQYK